MTGHQASPARAGLPAPPAATAHPHDPAGHPAIGRRPADLPPAAARKKTGLYAPVLLGASAVGTMSVSPIFGNGDIVTGVRGTTDGDVIVTGSHAKADGTNNTLPFLYDGPLTSSAEDNGFHALTPPFPGFDNGTGTGTFYGPDTSTYNPDTIPAGQVRAVGSYRNGDGVFNHGMIYLGPVSGGGTWTTIDVPTDGSNTVGGVRACPAGQVRAVGSYRDGDGVVNHGMIYLGPVSGGGTWTTIDVPRDGSNTAGGVRACPSGQPGCMVMDTIAHSTMGNLVVGNYDLNLGNGVSGNAFIYNMSTGQYTLLQLGGSLASGTTLYGIWQNGGPGSPNYTLAGGSSAHLSSLKNQRAFLMNYNERTGRFGPPRFYSYGNAPAALTHFDGITKVPGGFNLATISSVRQSSTALQPSMAFVPATGGNWPLFGRATWYPIDVAGSSLCTTPPATSCSMVTANTVYQNQVMGLYVQQQQSDSGSVSVPGTYLATVPVP